ncbi:MAG: 50S ribosomal protein L23 [Patescibacteria group bacterium]|nr:50S ribosomal protein L23 [Patescibacteria group bacterium]
MAIFNKKTKEAAAGTAVKKIKKEITKIPSRESAAPTKERFAFSHVLLRPRVTEKATAEAMKNTYIFDVDPRSNKEEIRQAVLQLYGVRPVKVHTMVLPAKKVLSRGKRGVKAGGKKAVIYLKEGDSIEFV